MSNQRLLIWIALKVLTVLKGVAGIKAFDPAKHLNSKEAIAAFLSFAVRSGDVEHFKEAIKIAARAENMSRIAESAGLTREGAYKSLKPGSKPQMQTIVSLLDALGMALQIVPKETVSDNSQALAA
ncbi:addiction module antidote protein [Duganella sp. BuS-21]|uniref:addiction module antidote protein n=1 Tax=Duganella sp. BuS-21 TaxID=2943848 RepID=UPI0035A5F0C7